MTKKRALISVSDKTGIIDFSKELVNLGFEIISTGGTQKVLSEADIPTLTIESITNFPEMLDGRVKTLHPKIHGGLLGKRDNPEHIKTMLEHQITPIDLVCVNLYPFKETVKQINVTEELAIENIDIGGPSMLRSASKNFQSVTVVIDPSDYEKIIGEYSKSGEMSLITRKKLAAKAFRHTASYDALIADYLTEKVSEENPESLTLSYDLKQSLRYGENSHQTASFYASALTVPYSIAEAKQIHGKELSYNNIKDADACLRIMQEFSKPTAVVVKHMNPCGIGSGESIIDAFVNAYDSDPVSIFGGIVALNREVDQETAKKLADIFLEIVIAPNFTEEALAILTKKKNIRLLELSMNHKQAVSEKEYVSVLGGLLVQEMDSAKEEEASWEVVTTRQPTEEELSALSFAYRCVKHVKSNAIVIATSKQTLGIGAGQMNRVGSVEIALNQAEKCLDGAVLSSDAFFPMADSVELIGQSGIKAIIQPGGSIKDQESIEMANKYGIAMIFTGVRHFKH